MWDLIVSVPDHCFSFYSVLITLNKRSAIFDGKDVKLE